MEVRFSQVLRFPLHKDDTNANIDVEENDLFKIL